jgi:thiamine kinase
VSAQLTPDQALKLVPEFSNHQWRHKVLPGGLTNRSFKVETRVGTFVLRLDDKHTAGLGLSRCNELKARAAAYAAGLAERVVFADVDRGILLSEYSAGNVWTEDDLRHSSNLIAVAELIRSVHALPLLGKQFDANHAAAKYAKNLTDRSGLHSFTETCRGIIKRIPQVAEVRCCHNDVIAGNIVEGDGLKLLDWEYALDNDPMFDLAALIGFHNLDAAQSKVLLEAYSGGSNAMLREQLTNQVRLFDAIQWLWIATKHRLQPNASLAARLDELQQRLS